jgi:white-opaque regulator 2
MAQSSESVQSRPEPSEARVDKLDSLQQPDAPIVRPTPSPSHPDPQPQLNGDRPPPSASVASILQSNTISDLVAPNPGTVSGTESKQEAPTASVHAGSSSPAASTSHRHPHEPPTAVQADSSHGGQNGTRNNGNAPLSPSPPMSNSHNHSDGSLPRQGQSNYSSSTPYQPPPSMHTAAQYAYPAPLQQQHDPYRPPPPPMNPSMALPSMRTFDHQQQQPPQPAPPQSYAMGMPMGQPLGGQMAMPGPGAMVPGPVSMGYYTTVPPNAYGVQVDVNGQRYAMMPEVDPRIILANRQKKVGQAYDSPYSHTLV